MIDHQILAKYLNCLLHGNRVMCRNLIEEVLQTGTPANSVYMDVIWPIMLEIEELASNEKISSVQEHLATRINRTIIDQLQNKLPRKTANDKKIVICCSQAELQELGAQMIADYFESNGWQVKFLGGGLTNDDLLSFVNEYGPDILLIYGTEPKQAPDIRRLIDRIKDVNAWPNMRIMLSGGLFGRAEGLWQEIGADLYARNAIDAVNKASVEEILEPAIRTINKRKKKYITTQEIAPEHVVTTGHI